MEAIEVSHLTFSYDGKNDILKDVSFSVRPGSFTSIAGPSGCGKSTLLSVIGSRLKPYRGKVKVSEKTATMPQNPQLLFVKDTLMEDFKSVCGDIEKINTLSQRFNVSKFLNHHPYDLSGGNVAAGQRRGYRLVGP